MQVEFWGTRGSFPSPDTDKIRYGGNTNCVVITRPDTPDHFFILDAGTGLASFGATLDPSRRYSATILLSHMALQHIIGFQFTPFTFGKHYETLILGPTPPSLRMREIFDAAMDPYFSPVHGVEHLQSQVQFEEIDSDVRHIKGISISARMFEPNFISMSWGYRLSDSDHTIAYLNDVVIRSANGSVSNMAVEFCEDVDTLILGTFVSIHQPVNTVQNYQDAVALAYASRARHLVLHNHHPLISDLELDRYQAEFQQNNPELKITVAFEGLKFEV